MTMKLAGIFLTQIIPYICFPHTFLKIFKKFYLSVCVYLPMCTEPMETRWLYQIHWNWSYRHCEPP